ncbi:hypothetical protein LTR56_006037 [Elasticomyces elasticus]|nr:hypothetical protein LTR56_006037 [Elasticomyces elasticus]KAK3669001.1 hypothetical protein LTR22_000080 [Elasticomyces elasticus]KAK4922699.1 hypothetical protein LTR49_010055 [Elasticomyces elasticus]KAK5760954.1 hypothetical protein LTS12_008958 [Elasticomyces elasticus]
MFQFINVADRTDIGQRRNDQLARSHTSKVNRQRSRLRRILARRDSTQRTLSVRSQDEATVNSSSHDSVTPQADSAETSDQSLIWLPRPVSPTFGALQVNTFSPGNMRVPGETVDYYLQQVLPCFMARSELPWYFQAYCEHPIVFHAMHYSAANHQDRIRGEIVKTGSAAILAHKVEAIRLLNESLCHLDSANTELLLFAVTCLWRNEPQLELDQLLPDRYMLFSPHMPKVNGINVYGRGKADQTNSVHRKGMASLIERADILNLKCTGMAKAVAGHDLIVVSRSLSPPKLPNVWTNKALIASIMLSKEAEIVGRNGFVEQVPGGLPADMVSTLTYLGAVDRILSSVRGQRLVDEHRARLLSAVNDAHHRVMSLLPWTEMTQEARSGSYLATYECCRLTSVLYSNAVLFPLPVASGWHVELLERLRVVLQTARMEMWMEDTSSLMIWSSCIASIAAYHTSQADFYTAILRDVLVARGITTYAELREAVSCFLWTDTSCSAAAKEVWRDLGLDPCLRQASIPG